MIEWSEQALKDRENIFDFISRENAQAAVNVDLRIREQLSQLTIFPESGRKGRFPGTRELNISETPFIVVYQLLVIDLKDSNKIRLLRVFHSARQWSAGGRGLYD